MPLLRRSSSTKFKLEPGQVRTPPMASNSFDSSFAEDDSDVVAQSVAPSVAPSVVYWPYNNKHMPAEPADRAIWFLQQVVRSDECRPGAYISPRVFIPNAVWDIHVDSLCARQLSMRAAFLESIARASGDIQWTPKVAGALRRKMDEMWYESLNAVAKAPNGPPSPPCSDIEQYPGPVRLRRGPKSHLRSLVSRRSASPDRSPNDLLYQFSPPNSLAKYVEAVGSLLDALRVASLQWLEFVIFDVVNHIVDDVLDVHERYMESVKFALLEYT